ncbi:MAG: nucleotide exchange factor GrpE [Candidatus Levybacteria bacterium]|nr:nucleotide exchange factor GrpE [Candidatus Levybacteria bacterium]MDZ4228064.1 nucleotide exchange factor GrpE [Candidatus Levybacteria bacterium]
MDKNNSKAKKQNENIDVEGEVKTNEPKIDESKVRIEELENQNKRVLADYRNLENRVQSERGEWILKANKQLLLNLLPVLDTLMLANKHNQGKEQSLSLSLQQFLDILKKEGVVKIDAVGKDFDPNLMDGIATGEGEEGKVVEEMRAGYMLYDKILRPAQVKVGSGKQNKEEEK